MKIRILGIEVPIKIVNDDEMSDGDFLGKYFYGQNVIKISEKQPLVKSKESLLHEVMHAIDIMMGIKMGEANINRFTHALYAVIEDNPHIFEYKWNNDKEIN